MELLKDDGTRTIKDTDLEIPGGDLKTTYTIRDLTKEVYRRITKEHTKRVPNKRTHRMEEEVDYAAVSDALLDYALVDWSGVTKNGQPVPCTTDNKQYLDSVRASAILDMAGVGRVEASAEQRKASFREPADVV